MCPCACCVCRPVGPVLPSPYLHRVNFNPMRPVEQDRWPLQKSEPFGFHVKPDRHLTHWIPRWCVGTQTHTHTHTHSNTNTHTHTHTHSHTRQSKQNAQRHMWSHAIRNTCSVYTDTHWYTPSAHTEYTNNSTGTKSCFEWHTTTFKWVSSMNFLTHAQTLSNLSKYFSTWAADMTKTGSIVSAAVACVRVCREQQKKQ